MGRSSISLSIAEDVAGRGRAFRRMVSSKSTIIYPANAHFCNREEFALFASHYCFIIAQTGPDPLIPEQPRSRRASIDSFASDLSTRTVSPYSGNTQWFAYKYSANPEREGRTHHGSAYKIPGNDALGIHGGVGLQSRLSSTSVYASSDSSVPMPTLAPEDIGARCCHTITSMASGQNLLVGGRGSPSAPMKDCWLQTGSKWERVHDLPEPRFRHRAAAVVLPYNQYGVVVFGGKTSATKVAVDCLLWDKTNGWQKLRSLKSDPMPRFGASFVRLGFNHGLLMGGMRHDGVICQGLWRWRLIIRDNVVAGISFKVSTALDTSAGIWPWLSRLGASYSVIRDELLLIGGVAKHGCIPKDYEILSIIGSFSAFGEFDKEMELRVACVTPMMEPGVPRPFLIGHSTHYTAKQTTLIVGGGATCFSFGAYWNPGCWVLYDREAGLSSSWAMVRPAPSSPPPQQKLPESGSSRPLTAVDSITIYSEHDFTKVLREGIPRLLACLDFGPCVGLWDPSYLLSQIPESKSVVVHSASSRTMNFQRKDFSYTTTSFHDFIKNLETNPSAHMYLRSISSTSPTTLPADFATDWPQLSSDFCLPPSLAFIKDHQHSSPLRISANVNMWLHYDVMANVLFQIRGTRKLILFPPEDLKYLSFPAGSTTSTIDLLEPTEHPEREEDHLCSVPSTRPHVAILRPGDALYIPPLWAHTGTPLSVASMPAVPTSTTISATSPPEASSATPTTPVPVPPPPSEINISLNTFFRTLPSTRYAVGRDVYGNRDLAAYEDGRRDVDRIVRRFVASAGELPKPQRPPQHHRDANEKGESDDGHTGPATAAVAATVERDLDFPSGSTIPKAIVRAYLERLAAELREKAEKL